MKTEYDYIIAGAGCAGLSLLMRMMKDAYFQNKLILVVDSDKKKSNDRTWCFWEKEPDIFEDIIHHRWEQLYFYSSKYSNELQIQPYTYKMIQGIDLYECVKNESSTHKNIHWLTDNILHIINDQATNRSGIVLSNQTIYAAKIFNSILFQPIQTTMHQYYFQQHFKGWVIRTTKPCFDQNIATFMDFRVSQEHGTTFMYVLPTSSTTALVEYTLFTEELLPDESYDIALKHYINQFLHIDSYTVEHQEYGIIPMTNTKFNVVDGNIIHIGIAGGQAKASSGYAFKFIQKRTAEIVASLKSDRQFNPAHSFNEKKGMLYDSTLLNVLHHKKMIGADIFASIFKYTKASSVFSFLDNDSSLLTDLQIMSSVPTKIFLPAALKEWFL